MIRMVLFFSLLSVNQLFAQTKITDIGITTGAFDSTFIIQSNTTDSFHQGNHPGAAGYSGAEIFICENATLKFSCQLGTSGNPNFYLAKNAKLEFFQPFIANNVFAETGATINGNSNFLTTDRLYREAGVTVWGANASFFDSTFTAVNYTFTNWPGAVSPCNAPTNLMDRDKTSYQVFPNPTREYLKINCSTSSLQPEIIELYNILGKRIKTFNINNTNIVLDIKNVENGFYILKGFQNGKQLFVKKVQIVD